jgi:purine-nucleoside phosphorylase
MIKDVYGIVGFIKERIKEKPLVGMITGTGLDSVANFIDIQSEIPYRDIPNFPQSTVPGHGGLLRYGTVNEKNIIVMNGRFHIYEGYTITEITLPIRVMASLGIQYLFISSAAGGLNPQFKPGDLMLVLDHINLTGNNPLIGRNEEDSGSRFPDMSQAYDRGLISLARENAIRQGIKINSGVYIGITGPSFETPAETRFFRNIGCDAIGMSTVNEVIEAVHSGLRVLAVLAITNVNIPDCMHHTSIEEVMSTADKASSQLARLFASIIKGL